MEAKVTIELSDGTLLTGILSDINAKQERAVEKESSPKTPKPADSGQPGEDELDFSTPIRPFMNDHAEKLSGSKKFALLVAYLAKGEVDAPVDRAEAIDTWNKMTGLMGGKFNGAHESRAKDSGWIYVPQSGSIALLKKWRQILT